MGVGKPDFREGQVENKAKTRKVPELLKVLRDDFPILSLKHPGTLHFTFPTQNTPAESKNKAKNLKKLCFGTNFNLFPQLCTSTSPKFWSKS